MKTLRIREENPTAWYSNNVRQPVITSHLPPCSRGENPKAMADNGKKPIKEDNIRPKKRTIRE
jgi:hypothetical protein